MRRRWKNELENTEKWCKKARTYGMRRKKKGKRKKQALKWKTHGERWERGAENIDF